MAVGNAAALVVIGNQRRPLQDGVFLFTLNLPAVSPSVLKPQGQKTCPELVERVE